MHGQESFLLEIELKARADLAVVRARLEALGKRPTKSEPSIKEDRYYCAPEADPRTCDAKRDRIVRIRVEGGTAYVTAKRRKVEGGVETNEEIELTCAPVDRLEALLDYMGYRLFVSKRKTSRAYRWREGLNVELNELDGLGSFVEIEALVPDGTPPEGVQAEVREVLAALGVAASAIEPRPYMDLLRSRGA